MLKNKKIAWTAAIGWMAIIFILSHQPASVSSGLSSGITEAILGFVSAIIPGVETQLEGFHTVVRKNAHFIAYFILGILILNALRKGLDVTFKEMLIAFAASVLYAASDEFHQLFIEGRSGELRDVLIDSAGAAAGIFVFWGVCSFRRKKRTE
ncbi:VanZ family protein [Planococcus sp. X10-3]|uniref:VanZ family protein n=1 Tax=Planococcus sp. X10-3 TaxID=3061240 RepID=UPI003BAF4755